MKNLIKYIIVIIFIYINVFSVFPLSAQSLRGLETVINNKSAKSKLMGKHRFSLQWISWDYFGRIDITEQNKLLRIKGEQSLRKGSDFITLEGIITEVNKTDFKFDGEIITMISYIKNGTPCKRSGEMTFEIKGNRKYWRLKEMQNPCDDVTDYIDIFFK
jgi:hypothetical protein